MSDERVPGSEPLPEGTIEREAAHPEASAPSTEPGSAPAQEALFELAAPEPSIPVVEPVAAGPLPEPTPAPEEADAGEDADAASVATVPDAAEVGADSAPADESEPATGSAPEPAAAVPAVGAVAVEPATAPVERRAWTRAPFFVLGAAWLGAVGAIVALMWDGVSSSVAASPLYPFLVFGGAALVLLGFVTGLVVWLLARGRVREDERAGVARAIWLRAVAWTAGGVAIWWVGLIALDLHRAGVI